jgi:hypothetical protein
MVAAVRRGAVTHELARGFGVALATVQLRVARAEGHRLDRTDFSSRLPGRRQPANRFTQDLEHLVLTLRRDLKDASDLDEFGARAI